ncbi:hypothetical protein PoB_005060900 [Plakobranchus ocellatus]|uniref:SWIM-type domain-containing protein n=1 Tax=Plakobranchus ocellatus TaxID=259542 RepID=A0AAV4C094_9GAST|nr:hypothetical protein PoB_005060900 [Plakobranchus ocellatus]
MTDRSPFDDITVRKAEEREKWKAVVGRSSAAPRRIPDLRDNVIGDSTKHDFCFVDRMGLTRHLAQYDGDTDELVNLTYKCDCFGFMVEEFFPVARTCKKMFLQITNK